jgi:predicted nuclease of predicted toxin-antitoxin system
MSRPRFIADHDIREPILEGLLVKEPSIDLIRARDVGLAATPDPDILAYAAREGRIVLSHDESTMKDAAVSRLQAGQPMPGLLIARQLTPIGKVIDELLIIWAASEADEWIDAISYIPL